MEPIRFRSLKRRFGFGPKRTSPSSLISSPDLGPRARAPPPPTVSPLLPPRLPPLPLHRLPGRDRTSASASSTPNPHSFPHQQIRPICGPLPAEIRDKAAGGFFFFPFFFRSPAPVFPFDSAAGSAPLLLRLPDCLFSSERAVSRGRRSRIRLRKRRFGPQVRCGVLPNFAPCGAAFDLFRWRRDDGFGEISLASVVLIGGPVWGRAYYSTDRHD